MAAMVAVVVATAEAAVASVVAGAEAVGGEAAGAEGVAGAAGVVVAAAVLRVRTNAVVWLVAMQTRSKVSL